MNPHNLQISFILLSSSKTYVKSLVNYTCHTNIFYLTDLLDIKKIHCKINIYFIIEQQ